MDVRPETKPLLGTDGPTDLGSNAACQPRSYLPMVSELWLLAWPVMVRNLLNCGSDRLTLAVVGHYDASTAHYDGAGLGEMLSNISGLSVGLGINLGLATLCSQSFGAGRAALDNGMHLRRCFVFLACAFVWSALAATFAEQILSGLKQPADVARASASFARVQLAGVPFYWVSGALQTVCDSVQNTKPGLYAMVAGSIMQVCLCVAFVHPNGLDMGFLGMAAARSIGGLVALIVVIVYIVGHDMGKVVWGIRRNPVTMQCFVNDPLNDNSEVGGQSLQQPTAGGEINDGDIDAQTIGPGRRYARNRVDVDHFQVLSCKHLSRYATIMLPAGALWWMEWWSFEGLTILVGLLPNAEIALGAHGTIFNVLVTTYQLFTALGTALCAASGRRIGEGLSHEIPALLWISGTMALVIAACMGSAMYIFRAYIAEAFTPNPDVQQYTRENIIGATMSIPGYALLMTLVGACRGANRQKIVALGTVSGYTMGLALGWYLGVKIGWPRPLLGVWLGNAAALTWAGLWTVGVVIAIQWSKLRPVAGTGDTAP
eukprot:m.856061 g.856061  ORF g.856061 m.856061 type:complete len:544 (-) comp23511_c0_seq1:3708-5339(-)